MLQAIGCGMRDDDTEGERRDWRLELDATVHRDQDIVLAAHPAQKLAILDSSPAAPDHCFNIVAGELRGSMSERRRIQFETLAAASKDSSLAVQSRPGRH
jgi:hypothetical protein